MDDREYIRRSEARRRVISKQKEDRKNKREFGIFAFVVIQLAVAILIVSMYILCYVREIAVVNNQYSDEIDVIEWLQTDPITVNTLATYVKYNYMEYELPGQMKDIEIQLTSPWSLTIVVEDKVPIGGILIDGVYIYCDEEGTVVLEQSTEIEGIPIIDNVEVLEYELYNTLEIEDIEVFKNVLEVTTALNDAGIDVDTISSNGSNGGVNIEIGDIEILLGEENYQIKIAQIEPILENLESQAGTLDLEYYTSSTSSISFMPKSSENSQNSID